MDSSVTAILTDCFRNVFEDDELVLRPEMTAADVDGWDSLAHIRLVLTVEQAFGIRFSASQVARLKNVGEMAALVVSQQRATTPVEAAVRPGAMAAALTP